MPSIFTLENSHTNTPCDMYLPGVLYGTKVRFSPPPEVAYYYFTTSSFRTKRSIAEERASGQVNAPSATWLHRGHTCFRIYRLHVACTDVALIERHIRPCRARWDFRNRMSPCGHSRYSLSLFLVFQIEPRATIRTIEELGSGDKMRHFSSGYQSIPGSRMFADVFPP